MQRYLSGLLLVITLISLLPPPSLSILGSPGDIESFSFDYNAFWEKAKTFCRWELEWLDGSTWIKVNSLLKIVRTYPTLDTCKFSLDFTSNNSGSYRFTFALEQKVLKYISREGSFNYSLTYGEYTLVFDWTDLKNIPDLIITHGVRDGYFWFRIRRDNIPQNYHLIIDPYVVVTPIISNAVHQTPQRKCFNDFMNGYYWVYYSNGTNIYAEYSSDAQTWANTSVLIATNVSVGHDFSLRFYNYSNTAYVYLVFQNKTYLYGYAWYHTIYFRRDSISGTTISKGTDYLLRMVSVSSGNLNHFPDVECATDGKLVVSQGYFGAAWFGLDFYSLTCPSNSGSGAWTTTYRSLGLYGVTDRLTTGLTRLLDGCVYAFYSCNAITSNSSGKLWNGTSWGAWEVVVSGQIGQYANINNDGDIVNFYYSNVEGGSVWGYFKQRASNGTWLGTVKISDYTVYDAIHSTVKESNGDTWAFFGTANMSHRIVYAKRDNTSGIWSSMVWQNEPEFLPDKSISPMKYSYNDKILVVWTMTISAGYDWQLKCDILDFGIVIKIWNYVSAWPFNLTVRAWTQIAFWPFTLLTEAWRVISSWIFILRSPGWNSVSSWTFELLTLGWHSIAFWIFSLTPFSTGFLLIPLIFLVGVVLFLMAVALGKKFQNEF